MNRVTKDSGKSTVNNESENLVQSKLKGTRIGAFLSELFSNSGHFLIVKALTDLSLEGFQDFFSEPADYFFVAAMLVQTWYLSRSNANRFWGNLIGIGIYTLIDFAVDRDEFFEDYVHVAFAIFSIAIAILQGLRFNLAKHWKNWIIPLESLVRSMMVVGFYIAIEVQSERSIHEFLEETAHIFLTGTMLFLGLLLGLQALQITKQREQLQKTAQLLGNMAEWGMGSHVVATALNNPEALAFHKCDRTIIFMDVRGFTSWCEQTQPDRVAEVLNRYYRSVEPAASQYQPLKISFTADEVMAIYATPEQGIAAAKAMQKAALKVLNSYKIGAGCGVHCGPVIEGLFGSDDVRTYTVIGDVVNTAKRLEGATPSGEITISDAVYRSVSGEFKVKPCEPITAKGKAEKLIAWRLV